MRSHRFPAECILWSQRWRGAFFFMTMMWICIMPKISSFWVVNHWPFITFWTAWRWRNQGLAYALFLFNYKMPRDWQKSVPTFTVSGHSLEQANSFAYRESWIGAAAPIREQIAIDNLEARQAFNISGAFMTSACHQRVEFTISPFVRSSCMDAGPGSYARVISDCYKYSMMDDFVGLLICGGRIALGWPFFSNTMEIGPHELLSLSSHCKIANDVARLCAADPSPTPVPPCIIVSYWVRLEKKPRWPVKEKKEVQNASWHAWVETAGSLGLFIWAPEDNKQKWFKMLEIMKNVTCHWSQDCETTCL